MDILRSAHNGEFFANAGHAAGINAPEAKRALGVTAPQIVSQFCKHADDPQAFERRLDLLEDDNGDACRDDESLTNDQELVNDGQTALSDIYGSIEIARNALVQDTTGRLVPKRRRRYSSCFGKRRNRAPLDQIFGELLSKSRQS